VIPDSYRSNFRPFYLQPPYALLSFCSLLLPGIGRGIVAPPLRDGFRSWLRHWVGGLANASWPNRVQHCFVYGLVFRFRLLSTPHLYDAVTFRYGQASVPVRKGLSPSCWCVLSGAPAQALRAWPRSASPSGPNAIRLSQRLKIVLARPAVWTLCLFAYSPAA